MLDWTAALVVAVMFFASLTRSTVGFGEALIAMPLLVMILDFETACAYVALVALVVSGLILSQDWRSVRLAGVAGLVVASWIGIPTGFYLVANIPQRVVMALLAVVILVYCLLQMTRTRALQLKSDLLSPAFGFVAGVLGGAYNTQGPPVVIFGSLRRWSPQEFRSSIQGFALSTVPVIVLGHAVAGRVTRQVLLLFALTTPFVIFAVLWGRRLNLKIRRERFVHLVHALLIVIACSLLIKSLAT